MINVPVRIYGRWPLGDSISSRESSLGPPIEAQSLPLEVTAGRSWTESMSELAKVHRAGPRKGPIFSEVPPPTDQCRSLGAH